jgi:hypothetical protein
MGDERNNPLNATTHRPRWLLAAFATPVIIIGAAVLLVRHFQGRPEHPYTGPGIILFGAAAAALFATMFLIWGWRDGERPRWIGIVGVCISLYFLKILLFAS